MELFDQPLPESEADAHLAERLVGQLLEMPVHQVILILKIAVESLARHLAVFHDLLDGNLIQGLGLHKFFHRGNELVSGFFAIIHSIYSCRKKVSDYCCIVFIIKVPGENHNHILEKTVH